MNRLLLTSLLASTAIAAPAFAQGADLDTLVITASRDGGIQRNLIGGSASVLTADDLDQRGARLLSDVLRDIPGIAVSRSGGIGGATAVRIRGAESRHVLVLVDGINIVDPVVRTVDFSSVLVEDGARIEVLRGQQSSLYGAEAIGGVIQYFTPDGRTSPGVRARVEYATSDTVNGMLQFGGAGEALDYAFTASGYSTQGEPNTRGGTRDLGYNNATGSAKFGYQISDNLRLIGVARASRAHGDVNGASDADGVLIDNDDFYVSNNQAAKLELQGQTLGGAWTHSLSGQAARSAGRGLSGSGGFFPSTFDQTGERRKLSYVTAYNFGEGVKQKVTGAIDLQQEILEQSNDPLTREIDSTSGALVYDAVFGDQTAIGAAVRHDSNDTFASFTSYRLQGTYGFGQGTRIRAATGTGIQYPTQASLYGYFGSYVGNPDLKPETSRGWEAGVEHEFGGAVTAGVTYFDSVLTNKIVDNPTFTGSVNLPGKSDMSGVEVFVEARLSDAWDVSLAYTWLDEKAGTPPVQALRRAEHIASFNINWTSPSERLRANLNIRHNGEQNDNRFPSAPPFVAAETLPSFTLVGLSGEFSVTDKVRVYARADNLFDELYEEVYSYRGQGRSLNLGVKASF